MRGARPAGAALAWLDAARDIVRDSRGDPSAMAPARPRRPSTGKANAHDRLRHPLRLAIADPPETRQRPRRRHARARHRRQRRGVLADQRVVPAAVPVPGARAARLHQRSGAALEPRDDRRQLRRFRAVARRPAGVRGHRAVRRAIVQRRHRSGADRMDGAAVTADFARVLGIEPVHRPDVHGGRGQAQGPATWRDWPRVVARTVRRARRRARQTNCDSTAASSPSSACCRRAAEFPGGVRLWIPMQGDPNVSDSYSLTASPG